MIKKDWPNYKNSRLTQFCCKFTPPLKNITHIRKSGVAPANRTKERTVHELFRRGIPEQKFNVNRTCFPKEKHQNSQKWAKFMNFSFWPFLWFGLSGRLLRKKSGGINCSSLHNFQCYPQRVKKSHLENRSFVCI